MVRICFCAALHLFTLKELARSYAEGIARAEAVGLIEYPDGKENLPYDRYAHVGRGAKGLLRSNSRLLHPFVAQLAAVYAGSEWSHFEAGAGAGVALSMAADLGAARVQSLALSPVNPYLAFDAEHLYPDADVRPSRLNLRGRVDAVLQKGDFEMGRTGMDDFLYEQRKGRVNVFVPVDEPFVQKQWIGSVSQVIDRVPKQDLIYEMAGAIYYKDRFCSDWNIDDRMRVFADRLTPRGALLCCMRNRHMDAVGSRPFGDAVAVYDPRKTCVLMPEHPWFDAVKERMAKHTKGNWIRVIELEEFIQESLEPSEAPRSWGSQVLAV